MAAIELQSIRRLCDWNWWSDSSTQTITPTDGGREAEWSANNSSQTHKPGMLLLPKLQPKVCVLFLYMCCCQMWAVENMFSVLYYGRWRGRRREKEVTLVAISAAARWGLSAGGWTCVFILVLSHPSPATNTVNWIRWHVLHDKAFPRSASCDFQQSISARLAWRRRAAALWGDS